MRLVRSALLVASALAFVGVTAVWLLGVALMWGGGYHSPWLHRAGASYNFHSRAPGWLTLYIAGDLPADVEPTYPTPLADATNYVEADVFPGVRAGRSHRTLVPMRSGRLHYRWVSISILYPWSLFAPLPALWLLQRLRRRWRAARRRRAGQCIGCGYDLRATRDRCPECGTAVPGA